METMQAQAQALAKSQKRPLKTRISETYWSKSHMECYHFYQQCEDYSIISGVTKTNYTLFTASFLRDFISFRWT